MTTNLVDNVKEFLEGSPVNRVVGWLDSTVALLDGEFKVCEDYQVRKIQEKSYNEWRQVTSADNPGDLGSRGGDVSQSVNLWWKAPTWLLDADKWPPNITTEETSETKAEAKTEP